MQMKWFARGGNCRTGLRRRAHHARNGHRAGGRATRTRAEGATGGLAAVTVIPGRSSRTPESARRQAAAGPVRSQGRGRPQAGWGPPAARGFSVTRAERSVDAQATTRAADARAPRTGCASPARATEADARRAPARNGVTARVRINRGPVSAIAMVHVIVHRSQRARQRARHVRSGAIVRRETRRNQLDTRRSQEDFSSARREDRRAINRQTGATGRRRRSPRSATGSHPTTGAAARRRERRLEGSATRSE